jgi:hypothetical protein
MMDMTRYTMAGVQRFLILDGTFILHSGEKKLIVGLCYMVLYTQSMSSAPTPLNRLNDYISGFHDTQLPKDIVTDELVIQMKVVIAYRIRELGGEPMGGTALDRVGRRVAWVMDRTRVLNESIHEMNSSTDDPRLNMWLNTQIATLGCLVEEVKENLTMG